MNKQEKALSNTEINQKLKKTCTQVEYFTELRNDFVTLKKDE